MLLYIVANYACVDPAYLTDSNQSAPAKRHVIDTPTKRRTLTRRAVSTTHLANKSKNKAQPTNDVTDHLHGPPPTSAVSMSNLSSTKDSSDGKPLRESMNVQSPECSCRNRSANLSYWGHGYQSMLRVFYCLSTLEHRGDVFNTCTCFHGPDSRQFISNS